MLKFWPVLFLIIPIIEVYLLIEVGGYIGAGWTILLVVTTAVIGVNLLRQQGISTLMRANQVMSQGQVPAMEMLEGLFLAVGGALLITPGFFTDIIGFICLLPFTRRGIIRNLMQSARFVAYSAQNYQQNTYTHTAPHREREETHTIEGEYRRDD